ncbi:MAG: metal-dependent transcriptional regulator [candidate division Zixibacteria bacterium]|nr:metal-dependent transcriptional regulator [candidate division Zixibacteria bacterium]
MSCAGLSSSLEDYLETIYRLIDEVQVARARDIARNMGVSMSSVTGALKLLSRRELVNYVPYELVTLTDAGRALAEDIAKRHDALKRFFVTVLAVDEELAEDTACRMEHCVPTDIVNRLLRFVDYVQACPNAQTAWHQDTGYLCMRSGTSDGCDVCRQKEEAASAQD